MSVIYTENISFRYTDKPVLENISFNVDRPCLLAVIGPNGSGKTTLLKMLDGTLFPETGRALVCGKDTRRFSRREMARLVAMVPQEVSPVFPFVAEEIVLMGRFPHQGHRLFEDKKDYRIVYDAMEKTDALPFARRRFSELSAGERQRVLIARALAQEPEILLLDESTVYLDLKHQAQFLSLIRALTRDRGLTVVFVTHDINLAAQNADQILLLYNGKKYAIGTPADVLTAKNIKEVYDVQVGIDLNPHNGSPRLTLFA